MTDILSEILHLIIRKEKTGGEIKNDKTARRATMMNELRCVNVSLVTYPPNGGNYR